VKLDDALLHGEKAKDAAPFVRVEDDGDDWEAGDKEGGAKNDDNEGSKASTKAGSAKGGAKTSKTSKTSKVEVDITGGVGVTEDGTLVLPDEVDLDAALLLDDAREAFHVFDVDGSGTIDHAGVRQARGRAWHQAQARGVRRRRGGGRVGHYRRGR